MTTPPAIPAIRPAFTYDIPAVAALIGRAFDQLPAARWLDPHPNTRRHTLARVFTIHIEHALRYGAVDLVDNPDSADSGPLAAAVWFTNAPVPEPPDYNQRLAAAAGDTIDRWRLLDAAMDAVHPPDGHDYLSHLAVHPAHQRRGLGRRLLDHHHTRSTCAGYLEAAHPDSIRLYERAGFKLHGPPLTVKGSTTPIMWPMWRSGTHRRRENLIDRIHAGPDAGLGDLKL